MAGSTRLHRIASSLFKCLQPAAWTLLALGVVAVLLLPLAAKKCYLDEKALLVGGALPTVRQSGAVDACLAVHQQLQAAPPASQGGFAAVVTAAAAAAAPFAAGLQFYSYNLSRSSATATGSSADKSSGRSGRSSDARRCSTLHTVVRAPRGDGSEGYVLMLPLNSSSPAAAALAAAVGVAAAGHLQRSGWLAKDAVLLFADTGGACRALESAQGWMAAYNSDYDLPGFPRAGLLQQALVLELAPPAQQADGGARSATAAELSVHGVGGTLPNLDLYFLIKRNLELHTTLPVGLRAADAPPPSLVQGLAGALGGTLAATGLVPPASAQRYSAELLTVAAFAGQLAAERPTGAHAAFLAHKIDAATLTITAAAAADPLSRHDASSPPSTAAAAAGAAAAAAAGPAPNSAPSPKAWQQAALAAGSALTAAEMVLRTFNNLQERLHHSTALYVLVSPTRFVSIAAYLAPPGCMLLAALAQLVATTAAAAAAGPPATLAAAWRTAWRRVGAAFAAAMIVGALAPWLAGSSGQGQGGSLASLPQQLLTAVAVGWAAAVGPPAAMAALHPGSSKSDRGASNGSNGSSGGEGPAAAAPPALVPLCTGAAGLAAAVLQASSLLIGRWARCCAFLLHLVPLYALCCPAPGASQRLAAGLLLLGCVVWLWALQASWLLQLLAPHLLLLASVVL